MSHLPDTPWTQKPEELLSELQVSQHQGLSNAEANKRRRTSGENRIEKKKRQSPWTILLNQFKSLIVLLLAAAAVVTFILGRWAECVAISVVVFFNALIGFITELRAVRSMEALAKLSQSTTKTRRNGKVKKIPSRKLVPGDIVIFEAGDTVSADMRLVEAARPEADESTLTGESIPVTKSTDPVGRDTTLAERSCMLFNGTAITSGSGEAVVTTVGMATELGKISRQIQEATEDQTPLEDRLDQLGRTFIWLTVILSAIVVLTGWLRDMDLLLVAETGVALAVAAIPEGMPIVATIALARGMRRMVRRNALVNRLSSVETLGSATIIATDKTGTLTENQMTVTRLILPGMEVKISGEGLQLEGKFTVEDEVIHPGENTVLLSLLKTGVLCGNAELQTGESGGNKAIGDPMEAALLVAGAKAGLDKRSLLDDFPEEREIAFDPDNKMMATVHRTDNGYYFAVKGAPEMVFDACTGYRKNGEVEKLDDRQRQQWLDRSTELAGKGLRILAFAGKEEPEDDEDPYTGLTLLGLAGFIDPPREDVKEAIKAAHSAGIKTIMVTGDQAATARNIAEHLHMGEDEISVIEGRELQDMEQLDEEQKNRLMHGTVFARVTPQQKLDLIALYQQQGNVVAMTGDGVNDAPALEKSNIGVAMGMRGTQVAREASDMILKDDSFSTIVAAIEEGRIIFGNIRQFVLFLLTISLSMILTVFLGSSLNMPMPILPLQILYLNAVTHVFPALALGMGEGNRNIMHQPPRDPKSPILEGKHWGFIVFYAVLLSASALSGLFYSLEFRQLEPARAQTISFLIVTFGQMLHVFNVRSKESGILYNEVTTNRYVWFAILFSTFLTAAILYIEPLRTVMELVPPGGKEWSIAAVFSFIPLLIGQVSLIAWRKTPRA